MPQPGGVLISSDGQEFAISRVEYRLIDRLIAWQMGSHWVTLAGSSR